MKRIKLALEYGVIFAIGLGIVIYFAAYYILGIVIYFGAPGSLTSLQWPITLIGAAVSFIAGLLFVLLNVSSE